MADDLAWWLRDAAKILRANGTDAHAERVDRAAARLSSLSAPAGGDVEAVADLVERAFELGFDWRGMLQGQVLEDSRAVSRTTGADIFKGLPINPWAVPGFETADIGICAAKAEIKRALREVAVTLPVPSRQAVRGDRPTPEEEYQTVTDQKIAVSSVALQSLADVRRHIASVVVDTDVLRWYIGDLVAVVPATEAQQGAAHEALHVLQSQPWGSHHLPIEEQRRLLRATAVQLLPSSPVVALVVSVDASDATLRVVPLTPDGRIADAHYVPHGACALLSPADGSPERPTGVVADGRHVVLEGGRVHVERRAHDSPHGSLHWGRPQ